ncbi:fluoride efflux transporter FluC [Microbacterium immunditiarum]|uniref:Fluoride-specific ion channel FluC n=1 Tax=Microbacterium immunditiarum TaxID=337480 RepID=A0A7Y9KIR9_9MICO|nr:CrcB family protein [Microbacterium immunditiarum]NYE19045.1 CrcB protein [Microbacterium immunditiarum]
MILVLTALAGGLGGALRFLVDTGVQRVNRTSVPLGTIVVNATACFVLGLVTAYASAHFGAGDARSILGVGLLGGYSTFSTASVEALGLLRKGRWLAAIVHGGGMLVVSIGASVLGLLAGALIP